MNATNTNAPPSSFVIVTPRLDWAESKPGRWVGVSENGVKYVVEEDKDWPIEGEYFSLAKLTDAPSGARHLGGASDLALVQDMALRHLTTGHV